MGETCTRCGENPPALRGSWCKPCRNAYNRSNYAANREHRTTAARERYAASDRKWAYNLSRNYGISIDEYFDLLDSQDGRCAICGSPPESGRVKRLAVDHDHETGRIRGLLCTSCNHMLGNARDDVMRLKAASEYLVSRSMVMDWVEGGPNGSRPRQRARFS